MSASVTQWLEHEPRFTKVLGSVPYRADFFRALPQTKNNNFFKGRELIRMFDEPSLLLSHFQTEVDFSHGSIFPSSNLIMKLNVILHVNSVLIVYFLYAT